ncbi:MAG TPA: hypothetical protein VND93_22455 [Myxococcales bacterium]|nr:hypothetical protein [Myxococcales bacterium]
MSARALAALLLLAGCTGSLDTSGRVHDLRMLGLRAEPPEVTLAAAFLPDGSIVGRPLPPLPPITLTGLIADPAGAGREVAYTFSTCHQRDADTSRCLESSPGYRELGSGTVVPAALGAEPSVTFTPTYADLSGALKVDPYHGFGGLPVFTQLEIHAGDEAVVGEKRVVFTASLQPLPPANRNPAIAGITFADAPWGESDVAAFNGQVERGLRGATVSSDNPVHVLPDASLIEEYDRPTLDGSDPVHFTETWRYAFFTTMGSFSPATTGGNDGPPIGGGDENGARTRWVPDLDEPGGPVTVWVVIRDGRGGESWVVRQATAPSLPSSP